MRLNKHLSIVTFCLLLQGVVIGQSAENKFDKFESALTILKTERLKETSSIIDITAAKMAAKASRPEDSWPSIMQLWVAAQRDFIELLWWQKDDRETRTLIVALFWCSQPPPTDDAHLWPASIVDFPSYGGRFASPEKELRSEEIQFVRQHLSAIAQELAEISKKSQSPNAVRLVNKYLEVAKKARGKAL